jgi:hypothetical protein
MTIVGGPAACAAPAGSRSDKKLRHAGSIAVPLPCLEVHDVNRSILRACDANRLESQFACQNTGIGTPICFGFRMAQLLVALRPRRLRLIKWAGRRGHPVGQKRLPHVGDCGHESVMDSTR